MKHEHEYHNTLTFDITLHQEDPFALIAQYEDGKTCIIAHTGCFQEAVESLVFHFQNGFDHMDQDIVTQFSILLSTIETLKNNNPHLASAIRKVNIEIVKRKQDHEGKTSNGSNP